jgi:TetR/AcrR family transcriptional repressor of mexJK operon
MVETTGLRSQVDDANGRSPRKRRAILEAATEVFLRNGYLGTSMDEVAAAASVSKQTIYKHFGDKERLFTELVMRSVDEASDPVHNVVLGLDETGDVESDLRTVARQLLARVVQPELMRLRRLVISEAGRFPELGRTFYERGPGRTIAALADVFEHLASRGVLRLDDPMLAAAHFNWLVMSIPLNRAMFFGDDEIPGPAELERYADAGVQTFLTAFGGPRRKG